MMIPFNRPYLSGKEKEYLTKSIELGKTSGNGYFTRKCHTFFKQHYGFNHCFLTTSCTDALEMASILIDCGPDDEIIVPSYTFTSTANPFVMRGAKVVFADSSANHPNVDAKQLKKLITPKTKAIVVVHYAGMSCDMDAIMHLADQHGLYVIEDAAQAIDSFFKGRPLGGIGHLGAFSFHETKNIISGEGGMLVVNDERFKQRAEVIWEKGTNRAAFFRGEVDKYNWVDIGSSFLPSEITAAFLFAQLENLTSIQDKRKKIWQQYYKTLLPLSRQGYFNFVEPESYATCNGHLFALVCRSLAERDRLLTYLKQHGIYAVFHYQSLHQSPFYRGKHDGRGLPNADRFSDCLIRLPLFFELTDNEYNYITEMIGEFYD